MKEEIGAAVIVDPKDDHAVSQKVVNSGTLSRSSRLRALLSYIIACSFKGQLEELSETRIAEQVFDRPAYHPAEDSLVRVSVRQLRSKLAEYYQDEGQYDASRIEIPKGAYHASLADSRIMTALFQQYPSYARNLSIHHAREMHARDFSSHDNFIIIGSSRSNPWAALFEAQSSFRFQFTYRDDCLNDVTQPSAVFCSENPLGERSDFARVLVTHNESGGGRVLTIAGIRMEATEAAGSYFLNPASVPPGPSRSWP